MLYSIKQLIVVLVIASLVFKLAKPLALRFTSAEDFARRRKAWLGLTVVAFLSTSFWLVILVALVIYIRAGRKDSNPAAFYLLMLHVLPPLSATIPMVGISHLFNIDNYLLLSFCVLLPAGWRLYKARTENPAYRLESLDFMLLGYCVLQSFFFLRSLALDGSVIPLTFTEALRRAFLFFVATCVPYYTVSRCNSSRRLIDDTVVTYCLSGAILAGLAVFEGARHWLLYGDMAYRWGMPLLSTYLTRGDSLRATVSTGSPLPLGFLLAVAFGLWLYVGWQLKSGLARWGGVAFLWLGLIAAYSRGPWMTAAIIYLVFNVFSPQPVSRLLKALGAAMLAAVVIAMTPLADKIVSVMPFLGGTVDSFNVTYRQRLLTRSLQVIGDNFWLGAPDGYLQLSDMRQGQGIVDLVNTYLQIMLNNGIVGLALFLSFILTALYRAWSTSRSLRKTDPQMSALGAALAACIVGTLVMMADGSFGNGVEKMFYMLAAFSTAYAYLARSGQLVPGASGKEYVAGTTGVLR